MSIDFVPGWLIVFPNIQKVKTKVYKSYIIVIDVCYEGL